MVGTIPDRVIERITNQIPVRRFARPEEIARVVHFLAADASGYITGPGVGRQRRNGHVMPRLSLSPNPKSRKHNQTFRQGW